LLDIESFRGINDRFGQEHGDRVLNEFARCLRKLASDQFGASRLGGDEFAVISRIREPEKLLTFCNDLLHRLAREMASGPLRMQLGASVGAAVFPAHGDSFNSIIRSAHLALYQAKRTRNDVCLYQNNYEAGYLRRVHIEQRLRGAMNEMQLYMAYQPQVDTPCIVASRSWHLLSAVQCEPAANNPPHNYSDKGRHHCGFSWPDRAPDEHCE